MRKVGVNRKVEEIQVADKTFQIAMIPLRAEYLIMQHDKIEKEYSDKMKEKKADDDYYELYYERNEKCYEILYEVVNDILEANGYHFDREWWDKHIDAYGVIEFLSFCRAKDLIEDVKKKVVESQ